METALFKTDLFTVLSYNDMKAILEAQAFSLSGCTDDSCAIEVGKLLAAENIVLGELSSIGTIYNLAIRLIDVGSSRTISAEAITFESLNEMQDKVFEVAYRLAGLDYNPDTGISLFSSGELYVTAPDGFTAASLTLQPMRWKLLIRSIPLQLMMLKLKALERRLPRLKIISV